MFYIVASTKSNYLKLLMIIGNVKQIVTYMEFEKKKKIGGKRTILARYGKKYDCLFWEMLFLFCFAFCYFSLLSNIWKQKSKYETRRSILLGPGKLFFMQEYNALKREMLFEEDINFVVDGLFYCVLLLVFCFHQQ